MDARNTTHELSEKLGYEFKDVTLLELACIHKSYGNEQRASFPIDRRDNERLEFLGDAILDINFSQLLLETYPDYSEGDLSKLRAGLVNERMLSKIAHSLELGRYLWLGKGEESTGGREKDSILSSTFEAIVAALYCDAGFEITSQWIREIFKKKLSDSHQDEVFSDFKTKLQELVQARFKSAPVYEVVSTSGPDHDKTFEIRLIINKKAAALATGKSKKEAEQAAARQAFEALQKKSSK